jgi:hypothetical protein
VYVFMRTEGEEPELDTRTREGKRCRGGMLRSERWRG